MAQVNPLRFSMDSILKLNIFGTPPDDEDYLKEALEIEELEDPAPILTAYDNVTSAYDTYVPQIMGACENYMGIMNQNQNQRFSTGSEATNKKELISEINDKTALLNSERTHLDKEINISYTHNATKKDAENFAWNQNVPDGAKIDAITTVLPGGGNFREFMKNSIDGYNKNLKLLKRYAKYKLMILEANRINDEARAGTSKYTFNENVDYSNEIAYPYNKTVDDNKYRYYKTRESYEENGETKYKGKYTDYKYFQNDLKVDKAIGYVVDEDITKLENKFREFGINLPY